MKNHAYLIMAHNEFRLLDKLISILDNPDADIYVHIDKNLNTDKVPYLFGILSYKATIESNVRERNFFYIFLTFYNIKQYCDIKLIL